MRSLRLRRIATHGDMKKGKGSPGVQARVCVGDPGLLKLFLEDLIESVKCKCA
jgi:hypothetical protein